MNVIVMFLKISWNNVVVFYAVSSIEAGYLLAFYISPFNQETCITP